MARVLTLLYGTVIYTVFLGVFLYAIGFVGNIAVPKSIDSGTPAPIVETLIVNGLLLALFALQHTGMARKGFKRWLTKVVPQSMERSTYVMATNVALIMLYWQWRPLPEVVWSFEGGPGQLVMWGLFALGWMTALMATFMIHHFDLFGLRQVWVRFLGQEYKEFGFRTPGLYRYVRHPIQVGFLIAFWAAPVMTWGHLLFAVATTGYIIIAVKMYEERDLIREFGPRYENYMEQVGGFMPKGGNREKKAPVTAMAAGQE